MTLEGPPLIVSLLESQLETLIPSKTGKNKWNKCLPVPYFRYVAKLRENRHPPTDQFDIMTQHHIMITFTESITSPFKKGV